MSVLSPANVQLNGYASPSQKRADRKLPTSYDQDHRSSHTIVAKYSSELETDPITDSTLKINEMWHAKASNKEEATDEARIQMECSRELDQQAELESLIVELRDSREYNATIKKELEAYQRVLANKRLALDNLNSQLDDIKLENEKMAFLLKSCTGNSRGTGSKSVETSSLLDKKVEHNAAVDHFLSQLQSTIVKLQECFKDHPR